MDRSRARCDGRHVCGREAIFRFLAKLPRETGGTYGSELIDVLASDDRAAALYRARGRRDGRTLELDQVLLFRFEDGLVQHVLALPSDPDAFEAFWASERAMRDRFAAIYTAAIADILDARGSRSDASTLDPATRGWNGSPGRPTR